MTAHSTAADPVRSWAFEHYGFDDDSGRPSGPVVSKPLRRTTRASMRLAGLASGIAAGMLGVTIGLSAPESTPVDPDPYVDDDGSGGNGHSRGPTG